MELTIRGESFEEEVEECLYEEYSSARCDALQVVLDDTGGHLRPLGLKKGEMIQAEELTQRTGAMYISKIGYMKDKIMIRALSTDLTCFKEKNTYRESISFYEMVKEMEKETGYKLNLVNRLDCMYIDITRNQLNPIKYLTRRLRLEGYQLRVYDNTLIVYDEKLQERKEAVEDYEEEDFLTDPEYSTADAHLIESVRNTYKYENYMIRTNVKSGLSGKNIDTSIAVTSIAESERFSYGLMREANKYEFLTSGWVDGLERKTGESINLDTDKQDFSGKNYIYAIKHDFVRDRQEIMLRKSIAGDY